MSVTKIYFDKSLVIQKVCINNSNVLYLNNIKILFLTIGWYDNNYVLVHSPQRHVRTQLITVHLLINSMFLDSKTIV